MLPIDLSPNLQLWPTLRCLETGVINGQDLNAAPFLTPVSDISRPSFLAMLQILLSLIQILARF